MQVLPVGDNTISISVKSKYCRENKMEVTLYRAEQEIPLELDATVLVEWNYEPISAEKYAAATAEEKAQMHIPSISGTTLPGATVTVDFPHRNLEVDPATGRFSFVPLFSHLGNNDVVIRASYEGQSRFRHHPYRVLHAQRRYLHPPRVGSGCAVHRSGELHHHAQGHDLHGHGHDHRIVSTTPQMAIMNIGTDNFEKLVMLENSSKTTWTIGTKYRIYGEAYGLYDTMPRLTVRYTYLVE